MCQHCQTVRPPVSAPVFLATLPRSTSYRASRTCLWNAFLAAQPPGVAPVESRRELFRQIKALDGVSEGRSAARRWFAGIAAA